MKACDRCKKTDLPPNSPILAVRIEAGTEAAPLREVVAADLCQPCLDRVVDFLRNIPEWEGT